jgi:hypothetical protein
MHSFIRFAMALLCAGFIVQTLAVAEDGSPLLAQPGKLLFADEFSRVELAPRWKIGMGFFSIHDGVVTAAENPADKHGAYAYVDPHFPYRDFVAEFAVRFDGGKSCSFRMDDTEYPGSHAGHIIRATITPTGVQLDDSKFGSMKTDLYEKMRDPNLPPEEKKQVQAAVKARTAAFKVTVEPGQWHQARVEVIGDEMLVSIDGKPAAYLKSEGVAHPTKNAVGFTIGGQSVQFDNVKLWEASSTGTWTSRRAEILASLSN